MKNFYISDLHFGHKNVIKFDERPFADITEMEERLVQNWNNVVQRGDNVYILGDFCWGKADEWVRLLKQLKGQKTLIRGNHDLKTSSMPQEVKNKFADIKDYKEITDAGRRVILCHYPIMFYRAAYRNNIYHLYGHVHNTLEAKMMEHFKKDALLLDLRESGNCLMQSINIGCMMPWMNYTPHTLDEIIEEEKKYQWI